MVKLCNLSYHVFYKKFTIDADYDKSLFNVAAILNDQIIGMGRLVGDGFNIWYIQDVIVFPEYQGKGVGKAIIIRLIIYAEDNSLSNTAITIGLMSAKGKEGFYSKLGFRVRPNGNEGAGMIMNIRV
jgi:GNAT superfamily N-acetyltransferase